MTAPSRSRARAVAAAAGVLAIAIAAFAAWVFFAAGQSPNTREPIAAGAQEQEEISLSDIEDGAAAFTGSYRQATLAEEESTPAEPLFKEYGTRTFTAFQKHPELVASFKAIDPDFDPQQLGTSGLSSIATFDGRTLLVMTGCVPHDCGDTEQVAAIELSTGNTYLLRPLSLTNASAAPDMFALFGNPVDSVRSVLYHAYLTTQN